MSPKPILLVKSYQNNTFYSPISQRMSPQEHPSEYTIRLWKCHSNHLKTITCYGSIVMILGLGTLCINKWLSSKEEWQIYIIGVSEQTKCAFPLPQKITVATIWWKTLAGRTRMLTKTTFSYKSHSELMILFGANLSMLAQIHLPVVAKLHLSSADCKTSWCKSTFSCSSPQHKKYDVFLLSAIAGTRSVKNYVHLPQQYSSSQEHKGQILYHQTQAAYRSHQMIAKGHECMKLEQLAAYSENCALGPSHWRGLHWHVVQNPRAEGHGSHLWSSDL